MTAQVTLDVRESATTPAVRVGLIHGLGSSAAVWEPLLARLPGDVEAWVFSFPWDASGGSAWSWERESRVWLDRALELAPGQPDVWVAHSFGANVLLDRIVARGTAGCRALVLMSPFFRPDPAGFDWATAKFYFNGFDGVIRDGIVARRGGSREPHDLVEAMTDKVLERISPYGWMRFFDLFMHAPFLDLSVVDVPCLVVAGGRDGAAFPQDCRSLAEALPHASFELLPDGEHFPMIDHPERVAELVGQFVHEGATP